MGLRIHTNSAAVNSLRLLNVHSRSLERSLERLSTGLRINHAADDPSGLVISEQLRAQLRAMEQASTNSQNATNMISIADAALQEVSDLLISIQDSIIFAQNTGGATEEEIAAEQASVDQAISAIDRIANTTRYADRNVLNGAAEYQQISGLPTELQNINVRSLEFFGETTRTLNVSVDANPQRGTVQLAGASAVGQTTVRITGDRGTQDVVVASGANATTIASAINNVAGFTGVYASGGTNLYLRTEEFGADALVKIEVIEGTISGAAAGFLQTLDDSTDIGQMVTTAGVTALSAGTSDTTGFDFGRDVEVSFEGESFTGTGLGVNILTANASFAFEIDPDEVTTDNQTVPALVNSGNPVGFTVANMGLQFQLNEQPLPTDRLGFGIQSVNAGRLGFETFRDRIEEAVGDFASQLTMGGFLTSIQTGQANDLSTDPDNAAAIIGGAIDQVTNMRGFLGALQADHIEPNLSVVENQIVNLTASLSDIRDLDFAEETINLVRQQILMEAGVMTLASANMIPQSILDLLS
ncbi:MAG: flagellin N-terminal helical domain-containing protein [Planctomycetota bacterium]